MTWVLKEKKELKPYDPARFYPIQGRRLPSVTTILGIIDKSGPLMGWAVKEERKAIEEAMFNVLSGPHANEPEKIWEEVQQFIKGKKKADRVLKKAANIGTAAHAYIEWLTRKMMKEDPGLEPEIPQESMIAVESWKDWAKEFTFIPLKTEHMVYSMKYGYAGTLDFYGYVKGKLTVGDYKTGKAIYNEAFLQNTAYRYAASELGDHSGDGIILRLPKTLDDSEFEHQWVPETDIQAFLACKKLWEWKRKMQGLEIGG